MAFTFLSTPPSRVATYRTGCIQLSLHRFYPRHPRGWRPWLSDAELLLRDVSIHATLAGGDAYINGYTYENTEFLSTPPSRVATVNARQESMILNVVSIHATLAGGDCQSFCWCI